MDGFGGLLGAVGRSWDGLGPLLGHSWAALGALLGRAWGTLGRSLGTLGRFGGALGMPEMLSKHYVLNKKRHSRNLSSTSEKH